MDYKKFNIGILCYAFCTISAGANAINYVPISVGDITVIIPINVTKAVDDSYTLPELHGDSSLLLDILSNDELDEAGTPPVQLGATSTVQGFSISLNASNQVVYAVEQGWVGTDSFTYQLINTEGELSNSATVQIVMQEGNDPPVAVADYPEAISIPGKCDENMSALFEYLEEHCTFDANGDPIYLFNVLANDYDPDGNPVSSLTIDEVVGLYPGTRMLAGFEFKNTRYGFARKVGNKIHYVPSRFSFQYGFDDFSYVVRDPEGLLSRTTLISAQPKTVSDLYDTPTAPDLSKIVPFNQQCNQSMGASLSSRIANNCVFKSEVLSNVDDSDTPMSALVIDNITDDSGVSNTVQFNGDTYYEMFFGHARIVGSEVWYIPGSEFYQRAIDYPTSNNLVDRLRYRVVDDRGLADTGEISLHAGSVPASTPPTITTALPAHNSSFSTSEAVVASATANDDVGVVAIEFQLGSGPWQVDELAPYEHNFGILNEGSFVISYRAKDTGGNYSAVVQRSITVSPTAVPEPRVTRFEWVPSNPYVGQPTTLFWTIENVTHCESPSEGLSNLAPEGNQTSQGFYEVGNFTTTLVCFDLNGERYPDQNGVFINAPKTIRKLKSPTSLQKQ